MKTILVWIVFSMAIISVYSYAENTTVELSPYRSSKYMAIRTVLLQVPLKLNYGELNSIEKSLFRKNYQNLSDSVEPPFPTHGLRRILDPIYYAQNKLREQGLLYVIAIVDQSGKVKTVEIYSTPSKAMSKKVAAVLFKTKFKPGMCSNKPCQSRFPLLANFNN